MSSSFISSVVKIRHKTKAVNSLIIKIVNPNAASFFTKRAWMNPAESGTSGRTFDTRSTYVSDPRWSSPKVTSSNSLKNVNLTAI